MDRAESMTNAVFNKSLLSVCHRLMSRKPHHAVACRVEQFCNNNP